MQTHITQQPTVDHVERSVVAETNMIASIGPFVYNLENYHLFLGWPQKGRAQQVLETVAMHTLEGRDYIVIVPVRTGTRSKKWCMMKSETLKRLAGRAPNKINAALLIAMLDANVVNGGHTQSTPTIDSIKPKEPRLSIEMALPPTIACTQTAPARQIPAPPAQQLPVAPEKAVKRQHQDGEEMPIAKASRGDNIPEVIAITHIPVQCEMDHQSSWFGRFGTYLKSFFV